MNRQETNSKLINESPKILEVVLSHDMGYEFTGICKEEVIFASPGMLINYSGGEWPLPDTNEGSFDEELFNLFEELEYLITEWEYVENDLLDKLVSLL